MSKGPRIEDGEIVPDVSRRAMRTLAFIVDTAIAGWRGSLDLDQPEQRAQLREWLIGFAGRVAIECEYGYGRAVETAIRQASALMRDPKRYQGQVRRSQAQSEKWKAAEEERRREREERQQARTENLRELIGEGKLRAMKGLRFNLPEPKPPEEPGA